MIEIVERLDVAAKIADLKRVISRLVVGKLELIDRLVIALLAEGSVLLEDVPGVGKTTLAKAFATGVGLTFRRVQCTPDLLPADVIGFSVFRPDKGEFFFQPGPIFCNILLLDEINRASPRTQSALLEAMAEKQVTIEGVRRLLESPFLVVATQNPSGFEGTFPLPESQLDRFLFKLTMDYPTAEEEVQIVLHKVGSKHIEEPASVLTAEEIRELQRVTSSIHVSDGVARYIVNITRKLRSDPRIRLGASPRGSVMLLRAVQARALLMGRNYATPDDVQDLAVDALSHRIELANYESLSRTGTRRVDLSNAKIVAEVLRQVEVPT